MKPDDSQNWPYASEVLKKDTLKTLQAHLGRTGRSLVDSWAASTPKLVQEWEKNGELLARAQKAVQEAYDVEERAKKDGFGHLSRAEMYELYGGPTLMPPS